MTVAVSGAGEAAGEDPVALGLEPLVEHVDRGRPRPGWRAGLVVDHGNQVLHLKIISCGVKTAWFGGQGLQAVAYRGRPAGR